MIVDKLKEFAQLSLFQNSIYMILTSVIGAGSGFIFWVIVSQFYSVSQVGFASAVISSMELIATLSLLGLDIAVVRYISESNNKVSLINQCFTIVIIFAFILVIGYFFSIEIITPGISKIKQNPWYLISFVIISLLMPINSLQRQGIFIGLRRTKYSFLQSSMTVLRIGIAPFVVGLGSLGIFISYGSSYIFGAAIGFILIKRTVPDYRFSGVLNREVLENIWEVSLGNYIARSFEMAPRFIFPIMLISIVGAQKTGLFYIAWQVSALLLAIPRFIAMVLLAENVTNYDKQKRNEKLAVGFVIVLLAPSILFLSVFGRDILSIFGQSYSSGSYELFLYLIAASIPFGINSMYASIARQNDDTRIVIVIFGLISSLSVLFGYLLIPYVGITGIGVAWCIANMILTVGIMLRLVNRW